MSNLSAPTHRHVCVSVIDDDFITEKEEYFFKIERTTGLTMGRYCHTVTDIRLKLTLNSSHKNGDEALFRMSLDPDRMCKRY